ncbi:MAG TPA: CopG family transcriptional regulator [Acetobacteraceae bacterium]|jgi:predicted transcriptional regulator|nr:CopG family transcriptional regulator [Acetobacteraceae bacterium]
MPIHPVTRLKLEAATLARLSRLADARQRPANQLMQEVIEEYLDREERREKFQRDAFTAWAQFQATGLHVTAAEADAWLARLEAGEDAEPPQPHH